MMCGRDYIILGILLGIGFFSSMQFSFASEGLPIWDKPSYQVGEWATITILDSIKNYYPVYPDEIYIFVNSDSDEKGVTLRLEETENNSSVFTGKIRLTSDEISEDEVFVEEGDFVYAFNRGYLRSAKMDTRESQEVFPVLISTDKSSYKFGEAVKIFGSVSSGDPKIPINLSISDPNGKLIFSDKIYPSYMLRFDTLIPTSGPFWKNSGNYKVEAWRDSEFEKAESIFSFSTSYEVEPRSKSIKVLGNPFQIEYSITSGELTLVRPDEDSSSLQFSVNSNSGGHLTVELPRNLIDSKTSEGDQEFLVLIEGREGQYIEKVTPNERTLTIPYTFRVKHIEVVGTDLLPNPLMFSKSKQTTEIPEWVRNNAEWWSKGLIEETDFLTGIEYLVNQGIIPITNLPDTTEPGLPFVPNWIKDTAGWWASEKVSDRDFLSGIEFLVENGIIKV